MNSKSIRLKNERKIQSQPNAFSQERKGLIENEKRNIVFEVTFEGRIFFICRRSFETYWSN